MDHPTLEDALRERDEAIARAANAADGDWLFHARKAVETLADEGGYFTTDDVWFLLYDMQVAPPREPRAMGPVMQKAVRDRIVKHTGDFTMSKRRHGSPIPVYMGVQTLKG